MYKIMFSPPVYPCLNFRAPSVWPLTVSTRFPFLRFLFLRLLIVDAASMFPRVLIHNKIPVFVILSCS